MFARLFTILAVLGVFIALPITVSAAGETHRFADSTPIYQDRSYSPAERAADLVARMTLAGSRRPTASTSRIPLRATSSTAPMSGRSGRGSGDPTNEQVGSGALTITPTPGDLTGTTNTAQNVLVQPALGDWTIESKLTFNAPPHASTQQAGIIAYQDDDNYLKLDWEFSGGVARLAETTEDSLSGLPITQVLATLPTAGLLGNTVWLRMVKHGPRYATYYSADGTNFVPVYEVGQSLSNVNVELFAWNEAGTSSDLKVAFDYFHVTNSRRRHTCLRVRGAKGSGPQREAAGLGRPRPAAHRPFRCPWGARERLVVDHRLDEQQAVIGALGAAEAVPESEDRVEEGQLPRGAV